MHYQWWNLLHLQTTQFALHHPLCVSSSRGGIMLVQTKNQLCCCTKLIGFCGFFMESLEFQIIIMLLRHHLIISNTLCFSPHLGCLCLCCNSQVGKFIHCVLCFTGWLWSWSGLISIMASLSTIFSSFTFSCCTGDSNCLFKSGHWKQTWYAFFFVNCIAVVVSGDW